MQRVSSILLFLLVTLILAMFVISCSDAQQNSVSYALAEFSNGIDESLQTPEYLELAGKVTDPVTGKWTNDYTVLLFLNGEEIARSVSHLGKCEFSGQGVHDGLFHIRAENLYELTSDNQIIQSDGHTLNMAYGIGGFGDVDNMHFWYDELVPGTTRVLEVPSKQIRYVLVVLESMEADEQRGISAPYTAELTDDLRVVAKQLPQSNLNTAPTAVPPGIGMGAAQLPPNTPVLWNRPVTGLSGNRWQIWEQHIAYQVPGISWQTFMHDVLIFNPHLVRDGYIFYPQQTYWLPGATPVVANN